MSGHSKWATIKRKKGAADAKRGKIFTKLIREITVSAKEGGGDPMGNPRLRLAIEHAKAQNMPSDNITRAIKKGTGDLEGVSYEESLLEGYGPGGVAVLIKVLTDNKLRTIAEVRHIFSRNSGNMGEAGCVAWVFSKKGILRFSKSQVNEEDLMNVALDCGAEDLKEEEEAWEILTDPTSYEDVKTKLAKKNFTPTEAEITMIPQNTITLSGGDAEKMLKLMEALEDHDDIQNVYANFDISQEEMEKMAS